MRAAVVHQTGGSSILRYDEIPDPDIAPDQVLIEVKAAGIQGGEVIARSRSLPTSSFVLGGQAAGTIREIGSQVGGFKRGDRVVAVMPHGSNAELASVDAELVWEIPPSLSMEEAAAIPIEFATTHESLFEFGQLEEGQTVLVQAAASGVGIATVQLAKRAGATVFGTSSDSSRLERLSSLGLDFGINYATSDVAAEVRRRTHGRGVDLVVDLVGAATLASSLDVIANRGRVALVGDAGRSDTWPSLLQLGIKNATMGGVYLLNGLMTDRPRIRAVVESSLRQVAKGEVSAVLDSTFPLSEAAAAHARVESRSAFGRVLLIP